MIENIFLLILALAILAFIGLLWLRHNLVTELHEARAREAVLNVDFQKRRDTVPYLLESIREGGESTDAWRHLVKARAVFEKSATLQQELEFEKILHTYLSSTTLRTQNFLEAKKDLEDLSVLIEQQKRDRQEAISRFNERCEQVPYSLARMIFGFNKLS